MSLISETMEILTAAASKHEAVAVAYSGGKDSKVVLDLAMKAGFKRLEAYYMYFVPGLAFEEAKLQEAEERYPGLKIHQVPHWASLRALRSGIFRDPADGEEQIPEFKLNDIYSLVMGGLSVTAILTGAKKADSLWRRRSMAATKHWEDIVTPLAKWNKHDVVGYLAMRGMPLPDGAGVAVSGIDLTPGELLHLWDTYPDDFKRLQEYFPYIEAVVQRRRFYGA